MKASIYVSAQGLEKLRADLERAEQAHRAACEESALACALSGDGWHDNPYFNQAQQYEAALSREVMRLRELHASAVVFGERARGVPPSRVEIGAVVRVRVVDATDGSEDEQVWEIVGYGEGDKASGKLAYNAPLAAVLMGRRVGELVETTLAGREVEIEVVGLGAARVTGEG